MKEKLEKILIRIFDLVLSSIGLTGLSLLYIPIAIAIKIDDWDGPVLFYQKRIGLNGMVFDAIKFRTMKVGSDKFGVFKPDQDDTRVTRVGKWLRRTCLDETPQLWNVFKGEMSMVGPRPEVYDSEVLSKYDSDLLNLRQTCKPGLTGQGQVLGKINGGKEISDYPIMSVDIQCVLYPNKLAQYWVSIFLTIFYIRQLMKINR